MSELIDQLRNLRALAYRKLTESPDFKVLTELDQMLARLDPADKPLAGTLAEPSADSVAADAAVPDDAEAETGDDDDAAEDPEAAQPGPSGQPPPTGDAPEILLATADPDINPEPEHIALIEETGDDILGASDDAPEPEGETASVEDTPHGDDPQTDDAGDDGAKVIAMPLTQGDVEPEDTGSDPANSEVEKQTIDSTGTASDDNTGETVSASDGEQDVESISEPDDQDLDELDDEALIAEALADHLDVSIGSPVEGESLNGSAESDAADAIASALAEIQPESKPAPVDLAPEENFDAAAPSKGESTDEAYDNALNRLNTLIERASNRLRGDDKNGSGDATVA